MIERRVFWLLLTGLILFYLAWSPFTVAGQGYTRENITAAFRVVAAVGEGEAMPGPISWPRHGPVEPILAAPFVAVAQLFPGDPLVNADRLLSLLPPVATALLSGLLFLWGARLGARTPVALGVALAMALATELWPYAYIGLETTQSLALFGAGYLALADPRERGWLHLLGFAILAAVAVTAKATGAMLLPAAAFLACRYLGSPRLRPPRLGAAAVVLVVIAGVFLLSAWARAGFWSARVAGGQIEQMRRLLVDSPVDLAFNLLALLASPNKGLAVFAPPALLGLLLWGQLHRRAPETGRFVALVTGGLALGFSSLTFWADETWGPRYLHSAIAPLGLALATMPGGAVGRNRTRALALAALLGCAVSGLAVLFYWGSLHQAAMRARAATLETLQHDPAWNAVRFHGALLGCWLRGSCGEWPPPDRWYDFSSPPPAEPRVTVPLAGYARPQPRLLAAMDGGAQSASGWGVAATLSFLLLGLVALSGAMLAATRLASVGDDPAPPLAGRSEPRAGSPSVNSRRPAGSDG